MHVYETPYPPDGYRWKRPPTPPSSITIKHCDGRLEERDPNGTILITNRDGSVEVHYIGGLVVTYDRTGYPTNSISCERDFYDDEMWGTTYTFNNGSKLTIWASGDLRINYWNCKKKGTFFFFVTVLSAS